MMKQITLVLADDHLLFREGIQKVLSIYDDVKIVGQASGGRQAIEIVDSLRPNVLLLDVNMPGLDGFQVCREVLSRCPETRVIVLTVSSDLDHQLSAINSGAYAYLTKNSSSGELIDTIRKVYHEGRQLTPSMAEGLHQRLSSRGNGSDEEGDATGGLFSQLSKRECEILALLASGKANKYIAHRLNISEHTVRNHISNVFQKLQVSGRTEAAILAIRNGII